MKRILLVEDDTSIAVVISTALEGEKMVVDTCTRIADRNRLLKERAYDLLLTDVMLADGDGIESLDEVRQIRPHLPLIILSARNTLDTAVRASDAQAFEYFPKPFDIDELVRAVQQAIAQSQKETPSPTADEAAAADTGLPLVGRSPPMQNVFRMITRVLRNDLTVLILGESGTGKEIVAEAIHKLGDRKDGPFVAINMAAIPAELIESELFGHEKGAFTGAVNQRIGKFEQAFGGTLFLDEIGDMPMDAQTRLLRALQSGRISRVGGRREVSLDVRVIAATNRDLKPLIEAGKFREDLFYRINVVPIELPPLRERPGDIAALAQHFLAQAMDEGLPRRTLDEKAVVLLERQSWRGNVRELKNLMYRLAVLSRDEQIDAATIAPLVDIVDQGNSENMPTDVGMPEAVRQYIASQTPPHGQAYNAVLKAIEIPLLTQALDRCGGNQLRAAEWLGINRNTLRKKLTDYGIDTGRER